MNTLTSIILTCALALNLNPLSNFKESTPAHTLYKHSNLVSFEESKTATYIDLLNILLKVYAYENNIELLENSDIYTISKCKELGFIDDISESEKIAPYNLNLENLANVLCNYLKVTDKFLGVTPGAKYSINTNSYEILSLYSMGIISGVQSRYTIGDICEYIAKVTGLKEKLDVEYVDNFLPIIMYHSVEDNVEINDYIIPTYVLDEDLKYLSDRGYTTLFMEDVIQIVENNLDFPEKPILLTFDDGYEDNYTNVFRIFQKYNMKAVICPIVKHYYEEVATALPHLTLEQTIEMQNSGLIEFANHSYDLHTNTDRYGVLIKDNESVEEYKEIFFADLQKSDNFFIENNLKKPVTYSYPYGAFCEESEEVIKDYGYKSSFSTSPLVLNIINNSEDLYELNRVNRAYGLTSEEFFKNIEMLDCE